MNASGSGQANPRSPPRGEVVNWGDDLAIEIIASTRSATVVGVSKGTYTQQMVTKSVEQADWTWFRTVISRCAG